MNTGLQDVWNLVWKLDLAVRGLGNELLLDSYSAERRPVIKHVLKTTDRLTRIMGTLGRRAQALRNTVIPLVSGLSQFQHRFVQNLSELGISYRGSPIIQGEGKRYFDRSLGGGKGINRHFLLLLGDDTAPSTKEAAKRLCESLDDLVELRLGRHHGITLVRPDGYLAFSADDREQPGALESIRSLLERQATKLR